jgi:hypothetical protein
MEVRKYQDIMGVVTTEPIYEGRMVLLTPSSETYDFGSREDLPGVKLPDDSTEAAQAKYIVAFASDNRSLPIYQPTPAFSWALRQGWDQTANVPFSASVYLTHPGNMVGQQIPSGVPALAYAGGVFTLPSGAFVYSANIANVGAHLVAANTADDSEATAGMPKYSATAGIGKVIQFNATDFELTFRIFDN